MRDEPSGEYDDYRKTLHLGKDEELMINSARKLGDDVHDIERTGADHETYHDDCLRSRRPWHRSCGHGAGRFRYRADRRRYGFFPTCGDRLGKQAPLGKGKVDFKAVATGLKALGYAGPLTLERECGDSEEQRRDIIDAIAMLEPLR